MLTLSDMSGRSMVGGFESYLTGYPVPDLNLYAFARTWYALEMERPGCVWTHTLLVDVSELALVGCPAALVNLFRRPTGAPWDSFRLPIVESTPLDERSGYPLGPIDPEVSRPTLRALYLTPDQPVFIAAANARLHESLVLGVWAQQWGELRARFAFCTGAISSRSLGRRAFDLQVVPRSSTHEIRRQIPDGVFVDTIEGSKSTEGSGDEWLTLALSSLTGSNGGRLRQLFEGVATWKERGRGAFVPLAELSLCTSDEVVPRFDSSANLFQAIAARFPTKDRGRALKVAVAGPEPWLAKELVRDLGERSLLEALATTWPAPAYDAQELSIEARSSRMWADDPEGAKALLSFLIRQNHNAVGEVLLSALLENIEIDAAVGLSAVVPGLLATIVRRHPSRAATPTLWTGPYEGQRELFDAATSGQDLAGELRARIVEAMLEGSSDAVADKVFRRFAPDAGAIVLAWYDRRSGQTSAALERGWIQALAARPEAVLSWITAAPKPSSHVVALAARLLNPHSSQVWHSGIGVWLRSSVEAERELSDDERLMVHGFCLALGLDNPAPQAADLVAQCFDTVHDAVGANGLSYSLWELWFDGVLPSLSWGRNWDKCERLRRGLVRRVVEFEWLATLLSRCTHRPETFERLLKSCWDVKGGKRALKELRREVENQTSELSDERRALVLRYS